MGWLKKTPTLETLWKYNHENNWFSSTGFRYGKYVFIVLTKELENKRGVRIQVDTLHREKQRFITLFFYEILPDQTKNCETLKQEYIKLFSKQTTQILQ